ncbi:MAG: hypothetical protein JW971_03545 [Synergistales bacterium]|nr:hypothetical protein [Synergistales bacterium]
MSSAITSLFWTGGWDSTFRLVDLALVKAREVQPYYILDTRRNSYHNELDAMTGIRKTLKGISPEAAELIKPTRVYSVHEIPEYPEITQKYLRLKQKAHLGIQYEWLARFAEHQQFEECEMALEKGPELAGLDLLLDGNIEFDSCHEPDGAWRIAEALLETDLSLFRDFSFPILGITKSEMHQIAHEKGFSELMDLTWFCHNPWWNRPCGICRPCSTVIKEGMHYRIPLKGRLLSMVKDLIFSW